MNAELRIVKFTLTRYRQMRHKRFEINNKLIILT